MVQIGRCFKYRFICLYRSFRRIRSSPFKCFKDNSILYKRLEERNYSQSKIQENVECEIMKMIAEEARQGYKEDVVVYLESNTVDDMENNSENIINWIKQHS